MVVAFKLFQNRVQVIGNTILITSSNDEVTCDHTLTLYNFYISNVESVYSAQTAFVQRQKLNRYCEWTLKYSCTGTSERDTIRRSIPSRWGHNAFTDAHFLAEQIALRNKVVRLFSFLQPLCQNRQQLDYYIDYTL